jgi:hypothetical protein
MMQSLESNRSVRLPPAEVGFFLLGPLYARAFSEAPSPLPLQVRRRAFRLKKR